MSSVILYMFAIFLLCSTAFANDNWDDFVVEVRQMSANMTRQQQNLLKSGQPRAFALLKSQSQREYGIKSFRCHLTTKSVRSTTPARSVHELKPSDIHVIGALGDSLTAANGAGASWVLDVLTEYRGLSWSAGGDKSLEEVATLPNILKKFNPKLVGFSVGKGKVEDVDVSVFNVAVPGSKANNLPGQARLLVERMKAHPHVDYANDWKLVTIFIGGNDLCDWVKDREEYSADNYIARVKEALDILHREMPRTFVNLASAPNVIEISKVKGVLCSALRLYLCPSVTLAKNQVEEVRNDYLRLAREINSDGRYDSKDDFTVVLQPFMEETTIPVKPNGKFDTSFFAPDCFHFSGKGHAQAAHALWNNMLQPVGQKENSFDFEVDGDEPLCPSEDAPYFYTSKNSQTRPQLKSGGTLYKSLGVGAPQRLTAHDKMEVQGNNIKAAAQQNTGNNDDIPNEKHSVSSTSIVVGVIGSVLIVACIIAAVVMAKRRSKPESGEERRLLQMNPEA